MSFSAASESRDRRADLLRKKVSNRRDEYAKDLDDTTSLDLDSATFLTSDRSVSAVEATW